MESYPVLVPLIILIPAIGAFINIFWGYRLTERAVSIIGTTASALSFVVAVLLYSYLVNSGYLAAVVDPPILDGWIRIPAAGIEIPWQMRVDTLSVTMMLFMTGVGTLIHIYAAGYMHGDPKFYRFFAYLNMFLAFILILVTANNFLMLFVGWEGVGLCSWLLIGFWWEKPNGVGWKNSNAARKAFIVNRVGDFGVLMGIFLTFWTFSTLDFYRPGELANPNAGHHGEEGDHGESAAGEHGEELVIAGDHGEAAADDHAEEAVAAEVADDHAEGDHGEAAVVGGSAGEDHSEAASDSHGEVAADDHGAADSHGDDGHGAATVHYTNNDHMTYEQLGVFGKTQRLLELPEGDPARLIHFGPYSADIVIVLGLITFFFLIGVTGKSAQIPLFVWLPDAMAGPTPVSALIHAATMVTAGIYLMVRSNVFFYAADVTSFLVTVIGVSTALVAGFIALGQWDIKRVLAYSTVSQLGFMVAAVGIGAYGAAMFHLVTHAFFKALLFLGSGSVIHGVEHGHHELHHAHDHGHGHDHPSDPDSTHAKEEAHDTEAHVSAKKVNVGGHVHEEEEFDPQDMRNMGGLSQRMPITYITYLIGTLALAGIWPFAGFWSKDEILADSWLAGIVDNNVAGFIALAGLMLAAAFTAFYMWRQVEMVFHGRPRTEAAARAPESHWTMTTPLIVLGVLSVVAGFINIPGNAGIPSLGLDGILGLHNFGSFLEHSVYHLHSAEFQPLIAIGATLLAIGAILLARSIYGRNRAVTADRRDPLQVNPAFRAGWNLANARLHWDAFYGRVFEQPFNRSSQFLSDVIDWAFWHDYVHDTVIFKGFNGISKLLSGPVDQGIVDGIVNGVGRLVRWTSSGLRQLQSGYVRTYAVTLLLGVILVIVILLWPWIQSTLAAGS
jgi:NADH-quinone oxidoreductase subunit L